MLTVRETLIEKLILKDLMKRLDFTNLQDGNFDGVTVKHLIDHHIAEDLTSREYLITYAPTYNNVVGVGYCGSLSLYILDDGDFDEHDIKLLENSYTYYNIDTLFKQNKINYHKDLKSGEIYFNYLEECDSTPSGYIKKTIRFGSKKNKRTKKERYYKLPYNVKDAYLLIEDILFNLNLVSFCEIPLGEFVRQLKGKSNFTYETLGIIWYYLAENNEMLNTNLDLTKGLLQYINYNFNEKIIPAVLIKEKTLGAC